MKKNYIENLEIIIILIKENISIETQFRTFDTLESVKKKIYSVFYPLSKDIILKYGNINISQYLNVKLGNLFPKKKFIKINIINNPKQLPNVIKTDRIIQNDKDKENNNSKEFTYKYNKLKLPPIHKKLIHNVSLNNIHIHNNSLNNNSKNNDRINKTNIFGNKIKLKTLNKNEIKNKLFNGNNNNFHNLEIKKNHLNNINNICIDCFKNEIKIYCRYCNKFICKNCKDKKHSNILHSNIELKKDLNIAFNKYTKELNNILSNSLISIEHIDNYNDKAIDIDIWKQKYKDGINKLVEVAYDIKNDSKKEKNKENGENKNIKDNKLEMDLIKKEYIKVNKINCGENRDPFETFSEINNKEKEIYKLIKSYKVNIDRKRIITKKINTMFVNVEKEIDKIMFQLEEQIYESKIN